MSFGLLGPLIVREGGAAIPVPPGKQRAVLATLLLNPGRVVLLDELTDALWGTGPPPSARAAAQNHVMRLRKSLGMIGRTRISTEPGGYLISVGTGELDLSRFELLLADARTAAQDGEWDRSAVQASAALALWRGEPLADTSSETLVLREVPRLTELRLQAVEARIEAELRLGRHAALIAELRQLTGLHPMREHLHASLMLALYRDGRQGDALAVYRQARNTLITELGTEPGPRLRELQERILHADPALATTGSDRPTAPPALTTPRQLPGPVRHFTGRTAELNRLTELIDDPEAGGPGAVIISAIGGAAGVGKTALAVYWANMVSDRWPDGQLYLNLRGYDPRQPMPTTAALAALLRGLGVPDSEIPAGLDARGAHYRSLLVGRRMLVLLDNAASAAQVRPLLPATTSCMTIVTSRDALAGLVARDGAIRLDLDLLPLADAVGLLQTLIGDRTLTDPSATRTLADQCCRLPLALRVAAELAAARPVISLASLVEELADQQQRLDLLDAAGDPHTAVRAVFSWSCRHLKPSAAHLFRLIGLNPGAALDRQAAAALAGATVQEADRLLRMLARAYLLQLVGPDQYGMHDLLRAYARELAAAQDAPEHQREALTRLLDHYLRTATAAINILYPAERYRRPQDPAILTPTVRMTEAAQARTWLDERRDSLVAAIVYAAAHGWPSHATRLAAILGRHLYIRGHYLEAISVHTCAVHAARLAGDHGAEAKSLTSLGTIAVRQGRYQQAADHYRHAVTLFRRAHDRTGEASTLGYLGSVDLRRGRYGQAAYRFRQSLNLCRETRYRDGEASALAGLGDVDQQRGSYRRAADHYRLALALFRETRNGSGEAAVLNDLGKALLAVGQLDHARAQHAAALKLASSIGDAHEQASAHDGLGRAHDAVGNLTQARDHWQRALSLYTTLGAPEADQVRTSLQQLCPG